MTKPMARCGGSIAKAGLCRLRGYAGSVHGAEDAAEESQDVWAEDEQTYRGGAYG